jgi:hypothetical protein
MVHWKKIYRIGIYQQNCNILCYLKQFSNFEHQNNTITKTGRHDIAEILLKVALNTINQIKPINREFASI